jgi:hypothetical protein
MSTSDLSGSFKTHAGYLHALSHLCGYRLFGGSEAKVMGSLASRVRADPTYSAAVARPGFDGHQLRRSLNAAWGSELLLVLTGTYAPEELRGAGNTWVAIQAYYACYHATQALVVARGHPRPASHPKTQNMFADAWITSPRQLAPWSLGAGDGCYANLPAGHVVDDNVHPWAALDDALAIDIACKAFRTTRDDAVVDSKKRERQAKLRAKRREWQDEEYARLAKGRKPRKPKDFALPRLTPAEHAAVAAKVRSYGLLDYLYRLRIKAQYEESTVFSEGPETPAESQLVYLHLERIVRSTLLLHELFIERVVGRAVMERIVDDWNSTQSSPINPLAARRALILP